MDLMEAMQARHSVRAYKNEPLTEETAAALRQAAEEVNREYGMRFQLCVNEPEAFQANKPSYGSFRNCKNYFALVGPKGKDELVGYCGERLVLLAQTLGVNSCWVALSYKKRRADVQVGPGEKLYMVIALGYGENQGKPHKNRALSEVSDLTDDAPEWYCNGVMAAMTAPTAINQQKFRLERCGEKVKAKAGLGFYAKVDLGIVKYHFELGAGKDGSVWA